MEDMGTTFMLSNPIVEVVWSFDGGIWVGCSVAGSDRFSVREGGLSMAANHLEASKS